MIEDIYKDARTRMKKTVETVRHELARLRTGRASTALLEHIRVDYYGTASPLDQVATVSVADARTIAVNPREKRMVPVIEKAILESDLGLNPVTAGEVIRIPLPALTEERRREITKVVRSEGENGKVAVRNIRRDALHHVKELVKEKEITEDDEKRAGERIQELTDKFVAEIDAVVAEKEREVMEV
ncbi:MAG: ribosome recycling factor [Gammaproteobacteria bacterium]|nr:ribosome recycling factor [Gammaproteobacteria bacterium]